MMLRTLILSFVPFIAWLPGAARLGAQEHAEHLNLGRLGRVTFPVSCTAEARHRFEQAMAVLHSFWWEEGDRAFGRARRGFDLRHGSLGTRPQCLGQSLRRGPARTDPGPWRRGSGASGGGPLPTGA